MPHRDQEIALLRREVELLMGERQALLHVAGTAAALIACLDSRRLPVAAIESADLVATTINVLADETLQDALDQGALARPGLAEHEHRERRRCEGEAAGP